MEQREKSYYTDIIASMAERTIKRLWILCIVLALLLTGSWTFFYIRESRYEDVYVEQEVDTGEGDAFVVGVGDVDYGESETEG